MQRVLSVAEPGHHVQHDTILPRRTSFSVWKRKFSQVDKLSLRSWLNDDSILLPTPSHAGTRHIAAVKDVFEHTIGSSPEVKCTKISVFIENEYLTVLH